MAALPDLDAPRPACSDAERRASRALARELRRRDRRTRIDTAWIRPRWAWAWLVLALVGVGGSVAAPGAPEVALVVLAVVAAAAVGELATGLPLATWPWPRRATQNVLARAPGGGAGGGGAGRVRVVLAVAYDTPRSPPVTLIARLGAGSPAVVAAALAVLAGCAAARTAGVEGTVLGAVQLLPTVALLVAAFALLEQALAKPDPRDPAAGAVAAALDAIAALDARPPRRVDVDLLLLGAGDARAAALPRLPAGDALVWLEPPPADADATPRAWHRAGALRFHPDLIAAATDAGYAPATPPAPLPAARTRRARRPAIAIAGGDPARLVHALDARMRKVNPGG